MSTNQNEQAYIKNRLAILECAAELNKLVRLVDIEKKLKLSRTIIIKHCKELISDKLLEKDAKGCYRTTKLGLDEIEKLKKDINKVLNPHVNTSQTMTLSSLLSSDREIPNNMVLDMPGSVSVKYMPDTAEAKDRLNQHVSNIKREVEQIVLENPKIGLFQISASAKISKKKDEDNADEN
ncbi:hypothetical protein HYY72_04660 [Candidatus Woesearchaeota archaeon]|nr:hypothetical protein [Candidatus Woesearchaeota archaeon]